MEFSRHAGFESVQRMFSAHPAQVLGEVPLQSERLLRSLIDQGWACMKLVNYRHGKYIL